MTCIAPSPLFNQQLYLIGKTKAKVVLDNFVPTERMFKDSLRHINITKLSMIVKVSHSAYSVKYTYDKAEKEIRARKLLGPMLARDEKTEY